jgi:CubicO group peptidase (beta-lactamase class C family)
VIGRLEGTEVEPRPRPRRCRATHCLVLLACLAAGCGDGGNEETVFYTPPAIQGAWEQFESPEAAGYRYSRSIDTAAVMVIHRGRVVYHWGEIYRKFIVHSCRKSFMSALFGIHVDRGDIDVSMTLAELGIDDSPTALTAEEQTATVQMLLQARSGVYIPAACESAGMAAARPERHSHAPGTFWYYNNWDFNALQTILLQETGRGFYQALEDLIANPIGMEDYEVTDGEDVFQLTSMHACYPVLLTARDMARFGQLFLQGGVWDGERLLSEEWILESTTAYSEARGAGGYGYMWWVAVGGRHFPGLSLPAGSYSARGYKGHNLVVIPELDVVVVHRVDTFVSANEVTDAEFGLLLRMILTAGPW